MTKVDIIAQESEKAFRIEEVRTEVLASRADKILGAVAIIAGFQLIEFNHFSLCGNWQEVLSTTVGVV